MTFCTSLCLLRFIVIGINLISKSSNAIVFFKSPIAHNLKHRIDNLHVKRNTDWDFYTLFVRQLRHEVKLNLNISLLKVAETNYFRSITYRIH